MPNFYQLFYFDAEEHGFDTYKSLLCQGTPQDTIEITKLENTLFCCDGFSKGCNEQIIILEHQASVLNGLQVTVRFAANIHL